MANAQQATAPKRPPNPTCHPRFSSDVFFEKLIANNLLVDYFTDRCHQTKYCSLTWLISYITANIIPGSGLGL